MFYPLPVQANPYSLFGEGNCAYFCWDMMERFWPETFNIQGYWDAKDWTQLDKEKGWGHQARLRDLNFIEPGDFIIFPGSRNMPRGHICFVLDVQDDEVIALESSNYADSWEFPYKLNQCRFRVHTYYLDNLKSQQANCLSYSQI